MRSNYRKSRLAFVDGGLTLVVYTYYVDPSLGNDINSGTSRELAWQTTAPADAVSLSTGQSVGYKYLGNWVLYRKVGMSSDEFVLPSNYYTGSTAIY